MFDVIPARLDGIQLGRVCRKIFKLEPAGMFVLKILRRRIMSGKIVPDDDHLVAIVMMYLCQEVDEVLETRRALEHRKTKLQQMMARRSGDVADARMIVSSRSFKKNGRFPDGSPGANTIRNERESAFIP